MLGLAALGFAVLFQIAVFATDGFWFGMGWLLGQLIVAAPFLIAYSITRRDRRARELAVFAARADYEHNALLRGDMATGIYGAFQPKALR
jgi:hypothetical protein